MSMRLVLFARIWILVAMLTTILLNDRFASADGTALAKAVANPVSLEVVESKIRNVEAGRFIGNQMVDATSPPRELARYLRNHFQGRYTLETYDGIYVIVDQGSDATGDADRRRSLDVIMSLQMEKSTVWEALKAWNGAFNEALAREERSNALSWTFGTPWAPRMLFTSKCVSIREASVSAREVLHEILRQSPLTIKYRHTDWLPKEPMGAYSTIELRFFTQTGEEVTYQDSDGRLLQPDIIEAIAMDKEVTREVQESWAEERRSANRYFNEISAVEESPEKQRGASDQWLKQVFATGVNQDTPMPEEQRRFYRDLVAEAYASYGGYFAKCMLKRDYSSLKDRLLNEGRAIAKGPPVRDEWVDFVDFFGVDEPTLVRAYQIDDYSIGSMDYRVGEAPDGSYVVALELPGTADLSALFWRILPEGEGRASESTIPQGGNLVVIMRRIDDTWYWTPFGW